MNFKKGIVTPTKTMRKNLPLSRYQYWYDIISSNDYAKGKEVLNKVSRDERQRMINLPFLYEDLDKVKMFLSNLRVRLTYPLHVAVAFAHRDIVKLMFEFDVCVTSTDEYGCNVFHNIITASMLGMGDVICSPKHLGIADWFVEHVGRDVTRSLLMQENKDGLRPVEYAAQQGELLLMTDYLSCKGVYVLEQEKSGLATYSFHDITEYELGDRTDKSPLAMLAFMDKSKLVSPKLPELILQDTALLKQWIDKKLTTNVPLIWMWFFLRISMIICYFVLDADVSWVKDVRLNNMTINIADICKELSFINLSLIPHTIIAGFLLFYVFVTLSLDLVNYAWLKRKTLKIRQESLLGRKSIITNLKFFSIIHEAFLILVGIAVSIYLASRHSKNLESESGEFVLQIIRGIIPILSMWSFVYFLQLVPYISKSVIAMEGMMKDVFGFLVLYVIVVIPYIHVFESFMLVNYTDGCAHEFRSPEMSFYTLFRMMLNLFDLTAFESKVKNISVLYMMHMTFIFVVAIMMINFLIAVMANSASRIARHESLILRLNQLALVIILEDNLFWIPKMIIRKLKKMGYKSQCEKICLISATLHNKPAIFGDM